MPSRFSKKLKELREENKETQVKLGTVLGVTVKQIQRYENDLIPKPEKIKLLNKHYKFDFFSLLNEDNDTITIERNLNSIIAEQQERLIRIEGHLEVIIYTIAALQAK